MSLFSKTKDLFRRGEKPEASDKKAKKSPVQKTQRQAEARTEEKVSAEPKALGKLATCIGLVPLMTEKGMYAQAQAQTAVFRVRRSATKGEIARAIHDQYNVKPIGIRTVYMRGKRRVRGRAVGMTPQWKKAYVKVEDVQKLHVTP